MRSDALSIAALSVLMLLVGGVAGAIAETTTARTKGIAYTHGSHYSKTSTTSQATSYYESTSLELETQTTNNEQGVSTGHGSQTTTYFEGAYYAEGNYSTGATSERSTDTVLPNDAAPRIFANQPVATTSTGTIPVASPAADTRRQRKEQKPTEASVQQLDDLGEYVHRFRNESEALHRDVQQIVEPGIDQTIGAVARQLTAAPKPVKKFDHAERERVLVNLRTKVEARQDKLSSDLVDTVALPAGEDVRAKHIESVLKSSIDDIALLINAEVGVTVDVPLDARTVSTQVEMRSADLVEARDHLIARDGLELYSDRDGDGVSDYDEKYIYGTNPLDAHTGKSLLTDGERILLGLDALSTETQPVAVQSPIETGEEVANVFEVDRIAVQGRNVLASKEQIVFAGRGLPNSFVTLFIFSTPIVVTIKADTNGKWEYRLDKQLADGRHELYLATVDNSGRILAKSPPIPFVKTAEAAEFTPLLISPASGNADTAGLLADNLLLVTAFGLLMFLLAALLILGIRRSHGPLTPPLP